MSTLQPGVYTLTLRDTYTLIVNNKTKTYTNLECVVIGSDCTMRVWKLDALLIAYPADTWTPVWTPNEDSSK